MKTIQHTLRLSLVTLSFLWLTGPFVAAQQVGDDSRKPRVTISNAVTTGGIDQAAGAASVSPPLVGHTWIEIAFACSVLVFGLLLVVIEAFLALKGKLSGSAAFKLIGLTIVISAGVFVIPAGFSSNQMSPLMGLLGAVAGYLLGKDNPKQDPSND